MLLKHGIENGTQKGDRTERGYQKVYLAIQMRFDLGDGFPKNSRKTTPKIIVH